MYREGAGSWRAGITTSPFLAHVALYVRDACGLEVPGDPSVPPRLLGGVLDRSGALTTEVRRAAGAQWMSWWQAIIVLEGAQQLGTLQLPESDFERLEATIAAQESLLDWPGLDVLADRPELREAVRTSYEDAGRWQPDRAREVARERPMPAEFGQDAFRPIAESLTERFGVAAERLRAGVLVVAVEGQWSLLAAPGVLCCSPATVADSSQYWALVEKAFVSGLEAVEVTLPAYQREPLSLPPSVLSERLVIWSGPELVLACERVIPYQDGFEIELRRSGRMPPPVLPETNLHQPRQQDPWERPDRFVGLEVRVTFADGLHVVRDDLSGPDQQENFALVLSRFWRKESDADALWLWVAPLPPEGQVKLVLSWPAYGIESAVVGFEGSLVRPARVG